jgi:hypothetical protein
VNAVLGLEQNEANISEAETARKQTEVTIDQGRTLMLFTIITIIFVRSLQYSTYHVISANERS